MRRLSAILASLALLAGGAAAAEEIAWSLSADRATIQLEGGPRPLAAMLRLRGADSGPALAIQTTGAGAVALVSAWPLMPGQAYEAVLTTAEGPRILAIAPPPPPAKTAGVRRIAPSGAALPANLLRLHIHFATPMARGQAHQRIRLIDGAGETIPDAFLNIGVELWSADQTRLTVMFDPGRLKQGVGPNRALGAPLQAGRRYAVQIAAAMTDAYGRPLPSPQRRWFEVGPAERRAIDPSLWDVVVDRGTLSVRFDRAMDEASVRRALRARVGDQPIAAPPRREGATWRWSVDPAAAADSVRLVVGPALEDAAGNTLCAPFDAVAGSGGACRQGAEVPARPAR